MTVVSTLDPALLEIVDAYRTCEFATLRRDGTPVAWPTVTVRRADGTFLITTSVAMAQKALNVRRDPRVALLFSDPTGSGSHGAPQLLVQGTAECPEEIVTGASADADYWIRLALRQPGSRSYRADPISRRLADWYFMRLRITVTPTRYETLPALPEPPTHTVVLALADPVGPPRLFRVRERAGGSGVVLLDVPEGSGIRAAPACLLAHEHDDRLGNLRARLRIGHVHEGDGGWTFRTTRPVRMPGPGGLLTTLRTVRAMRRNADRYLTRRGLARPKVAWREFAEIDSRLPR